jgi:transcriptional regulator with XRE-family HTH domain
MTRLEKLLVCLGEIITERRLQKGMSQLELAQAAGVHRSYMSDVERGIRNVTLGTLENVAQGLGCNSAELLSAAQKAANAAAKRSR